MSALGSLVVNLSLNHAQYTRGLDRNSQAALKFAQNTQRSFDRAQGAATRFFRNFAAGAAGAVVAFGSAAVSARKFFDAIDKSDSLAKMSQQTGVAVETLAGLEFAATLAGTNIDRAAKGIRSFSRAIADSSDEGSKNAQVLRAMGINMEELRDKTPEEQFFRFADAVSQLGEQDRAVAVTSLLGDRMSELVPLLAGGSENLRALVAEGQRYNPVTAESAAQAEVFNDNLNKLGRTTDALFISLTNELLPSLNNITDSMVRASKAGGVLHTIFAGVVASLQEFSKAHLGVEFFPNFNKAKADEVDTAIDEIVKSTKNLATQTNTAGQSTSAFAQKLALINDKSTTAAGSVRSLTRATDALVDETDQLEREIKQLTRAYDPLIKRNEDLARLNKLRSAGLSDEVFGKASVAVIEDYVRATGNAVGNIETLEDKTGDLGQKTIDVFGSNEQFIIQSMRNVQTAVADGLFNFFDDGLKGMLRSVKNVVGRIIAEFASIKLLQASGIAGIFGLGSSAATAATGAGAAGGLSGLFGAGGSGLGAIAAPIIGLAIADQIGRALAGNKRTGTFVDKIPVIGGFAGALFGRGPLKQRNTTLDASIGAAGITGGSLNTNFRAKGGLFRKNKNDFARVDLLTGGVSTDNSKLDAFAADLSNAARGIVSTINATVGAVGSGLEKVSENLGLSIEPLKNFNAQISLVSEKGEFLSDQEIAAEIDKITSSMVKTLIPGIDALGKNGETSAQTLSRINSQFDVLRTAVQIFGVSVDEAAAKVRALSIAEQTALVDRLGGVQVLASELDSFYRDVLTDSQKLDVTKKRILDVVRPLGIDFVPTLDQIYKAVKSGNPNLVEAALKIDGLVVEFNRLNESVNSVTETVSESVAQLQSVDLLGNLNTVFGVLQRSIDAERARITDQYNAALEVSAQRIEDVKNEISGLDSLAKSLSSSVSSLQPLSRNEALKQIDAAIAQARRGIFPEAEQIKDALATLTGGQSTSGFRTEFDLLRSRSEAASKIDELNGYVEDELLLQNRSLSALESQRLTLQDGFKKQSQQLDGILRAAQQQVDALSGLSKVVLSLEAAIASFNAASRSAGGGVISNRPSGSSFGQTIVRRVRGGSLGTATNLSAPSGYQGRGQSAATNPITIQLNHINTALRTIARGTSDTANTLNNATNGNLAIQTRGST